MFLTPWQTSHLVIGRQDRFRPCRFSDIFAVNSSAIRRNDEYRYSREKKLIFDAQRAVGLTLLGSPKDLGQRALSQSPCFFPVAVIFLLIEVIDRHEAAPPLEGHRAQPVDRRYSSSFTEAPHTEFGSQGRQTGRTMIFIVYVAATIRGRWPFAVLTQRRSEEDSNRWSPW
jgi:hypothetical protein